MITVYQKLVFIKITLLVKLNLLSNVILMDMNLNFDFFRESNFAILKKYR